MKKNTSTQERMIRQEVRAIITKMLKEEEGEEAQNDAEGEEESGEDKSAAELQELKARFVQKLKSIQGGTDMETMTETFSDLLDAFGMSSEQKMQLLKSIKANIVR
jgi:hypothetical protein